MTKLVFLAAFVLGAATMHQAAACDMGEIEAEVTAFCHANTCPTAPAAQQQAKNCDGSNCTKVPPAAANLAPALPTPIPVSCTGSNC